MTGPPSLPPGYPFRPDLELTPAEAMAMLRATPPALRLIDCRTDEEWSLVRVEGSVHIPLDELPQRWEELDGDGAAVGVICHHGVRSLRAALFLRAQGLGNVRSIAAGIDAWSRFVDPAVPRYVRDGAGCRVLPRVGHE